MAGWQILSSFPTVVPSVLLGVLLVYWVLSILGLFDMFDGIDAHGGHGAHAPEFHADHHADLGTLASYMVALGLGGVPFSIVASLLVFFTWLGTAMLQLYVLRLVPTMPLTMIAGVTVLLLTAAVSIPLTAWSIRPLRPLFVKHQARSKRSLVGHVCLITTESVSETFGRAHIDNSGGGLNIRVWARTPNTLTRNAKAIVLDYDEARGQFEVQAAPATL